MRQERFFTKGSFFRALPPPTNCKDYASEEKLAILRENIYIYTVYIYILAKTGAIASLQFLKTSACVIHMENLHLNSRCENGSLPSPPEELLIGQLETWSARACVCTDR